MGFFTSLMGDVANGWETIDPSNVPSYDTLGQILKGAGYTGAATEDYTTDSFNWDGQPTSVGNTRVNPAVLDWLKQQGYSIGQQRNGNDYTSAVLDSGGNPLATAGYHDRGVGPIKYIVPAMLGAMAGGAGLYAAGGLGAAGAAVPTLGAGGATASLAGSPELAALMGGSSVGADVLGMGAGLASGAAGIGSAASAGSWLSQLASGLSGGGSLNGLTGPSWLSQLLNVGSGIYGMKLAGDAREASDPFAKYRPAYGAALADLEANPNTITSRPGFQAGIETINRQMGAKGYLGSGNQVAALSRYTGDFYNQEAQRLAGLAGAGQTPGAGQLGAADLASKSLGSIGYGVAPSTAPNAQNQLIQLALSQLMRP